MSPTIHAYDGDLQPQTMSIRDVDDEDVYTNHEESGLLASKNREMYDGGD